MSKYKDFIIRLDWKLSNQVVNIFSNLAYL